MNTLLVFLVSSTLLVLVCAQDKADDPPKPTDATDIECAKGNASCAECTKVGAKCLWCNSAPVMKCIDYPAKQLIPHKSVCPLSQARWGVCWVNYEVLLIVMGCLAGVLLISCCCCVYCCRCKSNSKKERKKYQKEEARMDREREERQAKHSERRAERQTRMDEIRQKYGLNKDTRYQRFQDEA